MPGQRFAFGSFVFDADAGTLFRRGVPVPLGYRASRLLAVFLNRPGEVLSKTGLIDTAWEGAAVEEGNLSVQIASLRKHLGQSDAGGEWIATVPRVGYRFVGSVDRQSEGVHRNIDASSKAEYASGPAIAVLPFANLSDDPAQDYFADGMVEDIITGLARIKGLFGDRAQFELPLQGQGRGRAPSRTRSRRPLRSGGRRPQGRRPAEDYRPAHRCGQWRHIWVERYDRAIADIFAVQDEITQSVVAAIEPQLYAAENLRTQTKQPEISTPGNTSCARCRMSGPGLRRRTTRRL